MAWRRRSSHAAAAVLGAALALALVLPAHADASPTASRSQWHLQLGWPAELCPLQSPAPQDSAVSVVVIDKARSWVRVECERFAYQGTQLVYLRSGGTTVLLSFVQFDAAREGAPRRYRSPLLTGDLAFDANRGVLTVLRKYRGIGDCGQQLTYAAAAAAARLKTLRLRDCPENDAAPVSPERWPQRRL